MNIRTHMTHDQAAEFRALREQVGLSQQDVAGALGIKVLSVKRWEKPDYPFEIPQDAWGVLDEAYRLQRTVVESAVDRVIAAGESVGRSAEMPVRITYWRTQGDYDECHPHDPGSYSQANATARAVAEKLRGLGLHVAFAFMPTVPEEVWDEAE